jgi:hypothetical protein
MGAIVQSSGNDDGTILGWKRAVYEAVATQSTNAVVHFLKRREGLEVSDYETRFNPVLVNE